MKKLIALLCVIISVFVVFSACDKDQNVDGGNNTNIEQIVGNDDTLPVIPIS